MYYASFNVDTSRLAAGDAVHFDLYTAVYRPGSASGYGSGPGDLDVGQFAPFNRDAQSLDAPAVVPEPSTIMLLGSGLVGLGVWERRKFKTRN